MRKGQPSLTAFAVAVARAAAGADPLAEHVVPWPVAQLIHGLRSAPRAARVLSLEFVTHLELRTRAIDDAVAAARSPQLVILGAGLDTRAHRLEALRDASAVVFEVDHPATQAEKRRRSARLPVRAREVRYVGVDFERDALGERLAAAGHDAAATTTWVWEGVTPYLTAAAIGATLDVVAERSSPGSALVMTYVTPALATVVPRALHALVFQAFRALGEELRGRVTEESAHALLRARGLRVTADAQISDFAATYGVRAPLVAVAERVVVAERR